MNNDMAKTGRQEADEKMENKIKELLAEENNNLLDEFYYSIEASKTAKTKESYVRYVRDFFNWMKENGRTPNPKSLRDMSLGEMNRWFSATKYYVDQDGTTKERGDSIRNARLYAVKNFFCFLEDSGYINVNLMKKVKPLHNNKENEVVFLERDEISDMKEAIMNRKSKYYNDDWRLRDLLIFTLGIRSGLREGALVEINVEDVDLENGTIRVVEKGKYERFVYIGTDTVELLKKWLAVRPKYCPEECHALIISQRKRRISTDAISMIIKKYSKDAEVQKNITPHKMRSTFAVHLYEKTGDIYRVAEMIGHHNISNTQRYARNTPRRKKASAEMMDDL